MNCFLFSFGSRALWYVFAVAGFSAPGMLPAQSGKDNATLARVGDVEVKVEDVRAALEGLSLRDQAALSRDPALLSQTVRSLLVRKQVFQEATSKKWEQRPEVVARIAQARENAIVESYLQSVSSPPEGFPSEAELQAAYEGNKAVLLVPRQFHLAQVFVASPRDADKAVSEKALAKLDGIRKKLRQSDADFAAIATLESEERQSAERGGEVGWLPENQIQPELRPHLATLEKGEVSEPIRLDDGWHVVKVLDLKEAYTPPLEEIRDALIQFLRAERTRANSQVYLSGLLQKHPVAINELALSEVLNR